MPKLPACLNIAHTKAIEGLILPHTLKLVLFFSILVPNCSIGQSLA